MEQPGKPVRARHPTRKFTAYPMFMKYTPETGFLYSSRIITDSVARNPVSRALGKPLAKPQENSLFVEQAGQPAAEGRGDTPQ